METFQDLLKEFGVNLGDSQSNRRREEGCVIRSLESIAQTTATDGEWDRRFSQLDLLSDDPIRYYHNHFDIEIQNIMDLIRQSVSNQTPLGLAFMERSMTYENLTVDEMYVRMSQGFDLMMIGKVGRGRELEPHAFHLGYIVGIGFVEKSDRNIPIQIPADSTYRAIVFGPVV